MRLPRDNDALVLSMMFTRVHMACEPMQTRPLWSLHVEKGPRSKRQGRVVVKDHQDMLCKRCGTVADCDWLRKFSSLSGACPPSLRLQRARRRLH